MATRNLPIDIDVTPNLRVLAFTTITALAAAILFAVVPSAAGDGGWSGVGAGTPGMRATRRGSRWLPVLVSGQIALALLLLAGAGLFVRTLVNLQQVDTGFDAAGVLLVPLDARAGRHA